MATLGNTCDLITDHCAPQSSGASVYVGLEHIDGGAFRLKRHGHPSDVQSAKHCFLRGDILYGKLRPYLDKAVLADTDGICSTDILVFRPKKEVDPRYLLAIIHTAAFQSFAAATTKGVNHPRTSWGALSHFECDVPSRSEQERISAILWTVQCAIEIEDRLIHALGALANATSEHLFSFGIRQDLQVETTIGLTPRSWAVVRLGDLTKVRGGKRLPKGTSLVDEDTGFPYIRVTDMRGQSVNREGLLFVPREVQPRISRYIIRSDEVYISIAGTIGTTGMVPPELDGANLTENAARLTITDRRCLPKFLMFALQTRAVQEQFRKHTAKNAQPKLALTRIEQVLVPLPLSIDEQVAIVGILERLNARRTIHERRRQTLRTLFREVLSRLMSASDPARDIAAALSSDTVRCASETP